MTTNSEHLVHAENIFIKGNKFDPERIKFIENLETCDLLAVPGSGKTTALMAKLYLLSKKLHFEDDSGSLILSHTNAAVHEIEKKLKTHCPKFFEYPNFVETVQGFINKFLANQANFLKHECYLNKVDDILANQRILNSIKAQKNSFYWFLVNQIKSNYSHLTIEFIKEINIAMDGMVLIEKLKLQKILDKKGNLVFDYNKVKNADLSFQEKTIVFDFNKRVNSISQDDQNLINKIASFRIDFIESKFVSSTTSLKFSTSSGSNFLNALSENLENGYARFSDCYSLASWYLLTYPMLKEQLQQRFKYIFIDEMQDLEDYQIELIDTIFANGEKCSIVQRIGDINQAIYNSGKGVKIECDWKTRKELYLNGSNRLTKANADLVNYFTLNSREGKFVVEGKKELSFGDIPPHLIVFTQSTQDQLKERFENLISSFNLKETEEAKHGFKIIGWTGERQDEGDGKLCLHTLFGFNKESKSSKEDFDSLSKYLQLFNKEKNTLEAARKSILNALINILRFEGKKTIKVIRGRKVERFFTKNDLVEFIKKYNGDKENINAYEGFKQKLFEWCFNLVTAKEYSKIYSEIVGFINNDLKLWFELQLNGPETIRFIGGVFEPVLSTEVICRASDKPSSAINIEISTIHSIKGQTHCATMYVETAYNTPIYETLKLKEESKTNTEKKKGLKTNPLFKQMHTCQGAYAKQALKMMYVGFSRPTHLLCFAALKDNIQQDVEKFRKSGWEIIDLTLKN